jgi:hypothetical protein
MAGFFDGFDVRVPHVHEDGLDGFSLLRRQLVEEAEGLSLALFALVNDVAGFLV